MLQELALERSVPCISPAGQLGDVVVHYFDFLQPGLGFEQLFLHLGLTLEEPLVVADELLLLALEVLLKFLLATTVTLAFDMVFPPERDHLLLQLGDPLLTKRLGRFRILIGFKLLFLEELKLLPVTL